MLSAGAIQPISGFCTARKLKVDVVLINFKVKKNQKNISQHMKMTQKPSFGTCN